MAIETTLVKAASVAAAAGRLARRAGDTVLNQLFPPVCPVCDGPVDSADGLCGDCWRALRPITPPLCPVLGLPFAASLGPDTLSAEAIADPPPFRRARSAVIYNSVAQTIVAALKYGDRPEIARLCARLMTVAGRELLAGEPVLVPVPLHRMRLWSRRYNQAGELARALAAPLRLSVDPALVRRKRPTPRQVGMSREARLRNVAGAFVAHPDILGRLRGRPVLVIDDVITTGATVKSMTRALNRAGVDDVDVLSFARVVIGAELPI